MCRRLAGGAEKVFREYRSLLGSSSGPQPCPQYSCESQGIVR